MFTVASFQADPGLKPACVSSHNQKTWRLGMLQTTKRPVDMNAFVCMCSVMDW